MHNCIVAYLANFYFTVLHDYSKAFALCDMVLNVRSIETDLVFSERIFLYSLRMNCLQYSMNIFELFSDLLLCTGPLLIRYRTILRF